MIKISPSLILLEPDLTSGNYCKCFIANLQRICYVEEFYEVMKFDEWQRKNIEISVWQLVIIICIICCFIFLPQKDMFVLFIIQS